MFGVNCSPFLAQDVSQRHAKDHIQEFPLAAETIMNSTYMDDSLDSAPGLDTALELCRQLGRLWKKAGMKPHKWLSNKPEILEGIPIEDRASEVDLDSADRPTMKNLGINNNNIIICSSYIALFLAEASSKRFTYYYPWQACSIRHLLNSLGNIHPLTRFKVPWVI